MNILRDASPTAHWNRQESQGSNQQWVSMAQVMTSPVPLQAIIWTNEGVVYWWTYLSLGAPFTNMV